jgi:hypothetical protein
MRSFLSMCGALVVLGACGHEPSDPLSTPESDTVTRAPDRAPGDDDGDATDPSEPSEPSDGATPGSGPMLGAPIELEPDQYEKWVWISMPEMKCADGTEGGFAVNFTKRSPDLLLYLQGGGICYDALTCVSAAQSVGPNPIASALEASVRNGVGAFDRNDPTNPFRDSSFVSVPHCTGDHHTGNKISTYGQKTYHHVGYTNITRVAERLVPTFKAPGRVVLSGFSAGGVGITANYHQIATAFESVGKGSPYLVIDAGPFMRPPYLQKSAQERLRKNWGLDNTIGTFCKACSTDGFHAMYEVNSKLHPGLRSSLVCSYEDDVVVTLYRVMNLDVLNLFRMKPGMIDLADWKASIAPTVTPSMHRVFYFHGKRHGSLTFPLGDTPGLVDFLKGQLGTGNWPSVRP